MALILCTTATFRLPTTVLSSLRHVKPYTRTFISLSKSKLNVNKPKCCYAVLNSHNAIAYKTCRNIKSFDLLSYLKYNQRIFFSLARLSKRSGFYHIAWLPGLSLLNKFRKPDHTLSPDILANIPAEVTRKEPVKKKKKRNIIVRIFITLVEWIRFGLRLARILITFIPLAIVYPLICWSDRLKYLYWMVLRSTLEGLGTTYIKLGQWAGTRRDLFSPQFCDILSALHVKTMVHPWSVTKKKLRKAFGKRWREILVRVHKTPLGSGCIAQVHKAYMPADMIPDETLADELMENAESDDDPEVDFAVGLEIVGLGSRDDDNDNDDNSQDMADYTHKSHPHTTTTSATSDVTYESPDIEDNTDDDISEDKVESASSSNLGEEPQLVPVAVKVLHPGVYPMVYRDLRILSSLAWLAEKLCPPLRWLSLSECMQEFTVLLIKQIDLRMEAECLEIFNENFADNPNIRFPKPVWPYCRKGVMIETFEEGEPISNYLNTDSECEIPEGLNEKLASFGVDALLQMIFVDNFVHGDLHPGNILVQNMAEYSPGQDENKLMLVDVGDTVIINIKPIDCPVRLVMLDVGITASLSEHDLENFRNVFTAVVIGDGATVADLMLRHARSNECKNVEKFKEELSNLVMDARKCTISLGKIQVGKLLSDVFILLSKHHVKMESNFVSVLLAIFVLEGLGRSLDPELNILEKARPILLNSRE